MVVLAQHFYSENFPTYGSMQRYKQHRVIAPSIIRQVFTWFFTSLARQTPPTPTGEESGQMPIPSSFLTRRKFFGVLIGLMLKINECDVKQRCGNHTIHYTLPHIRPNVILHALRLCLHLVTTADWAKRTRYRHLTRLFPPWVWSLACETN